MNDTRWRQRYDRTETQVNAWHINPAMCIDAVSEITEEEAQAFLAQVNETQRINARRGAVVVAEDYKSAIVGSEYYTLKGRSKWRKVVFRD